VVNCVNGWRSLGHGSLDGKGWVGIWKLQYTHLVYWQQKVALPISQIHSHCTCIRVSSERTLFYS